MSKMKTGALVGAAMIAAVAGHAAAQCSVSTGPDVIVGRIIGASGAGSQIQNYNVSGTLDAVSLGTTSCNIGNALLRWDAFPANTHPAIGGNMYKWKTVNGSGRFEQIGMSWLKHGFTALAQSECCTCTNPGTGTRLGIGCSDPYTGSRNGGQGSAGPRWQINAATGFFPTGSSANPTRSATNTDRRLEMLLTDLEVSSAAVRYFGEAQYVSPDDAAAGNKNNNASYIECTVAAGTAATGFNFSFINTGAGTGPNTTQRQKSAIEAWPLVEPGVTLTNVLVPSDGKFIVGSKATDLGGGIWHYEYAVYNMNSDRNGGSFSVPVPAGVNVTNIGFHDVTYRNGDATDNLGVGMSNAINFSSTDWAATVATGSITWATELEGANVRANAIRWGTTYNFRFDANIAPNLTGEVSLGLWKHGTPDSMAVVAQIPGTPSVSCAADLDNDGNFGNGGTPDGGVDINDLLFFLTAFENGSISVDLDNDGDPAVGTPDGGVDINDLLYFLAQFELGNMDLDNDGVDPQLPDGGTDINDLLFFLFHFEAGC